MSNIETMTEEELDKLFEPPIYSGTLTEESWLAACNSWPKQSGSRKPMPLVITRGSWVYVSKSGWVTVLGAFSSQSASKEQFKEAFGVDLGEKNDYVATLGKLLPEEFWTKGKES